MNKLQTVVLIIVVLLMLVLGMFTFLNHDAVAVQNFSATVNRDCAPWDGSAFTVQVPLDDGDVIVISIWQAPDIKLLRKFVFPDDTGQVGNVSLIHPTGLPDQLTGEVWFQSVSEDETVEGRFRLKSERSEYVGRFSAQWTDQLMLCG